MSKIIVLCGFISFLFFACKPYKDPAPTVTDKLTKKYCNDPSAINYNWDFPGIADNSVCIYPAQIFSGNYFYRDSILDASGNLVKKDSFPIVLTQIDSVKLTITGFCVGNPLQATANRYYKFVVDSTHGWGQKMCSTTDTFSGGAQFLAIGDSLLKFNFIVFADTGKIIHKGTAKKL